MLISRYPKTDGRTEPRRSCARVNTETLGPNFAQKGIVARVQLRNRVEPSLLVPSCKIKFGYLKISTIPTISLSSLFLSKF